MKHKDIYLVLHNIRSAYNVGAIFRTADAAGIKKIFLCGYTPCPTMDNRLSPVEKIKKTALGAEKTVLWEYRKQTWRCLFELKNQNLKIKIIGVEQARESENIFKFKPKFPMALILGNEVKGLSQSILRYCDNVIEIPMLGKKESLNVSIAAGIAIYQLKFGK